jgi:hypothetical protein
MLLLPLPPSKDSATPAQPVLICTYLLSVSTAPLPQVCKWLGLVLALLQLLTLLLSCWLQAAYVRAEEAAEDADEEAAWHRRPLLQAQARQVLVLEIRSRQR